MNRLPISVRLKPPFLIAGLQSFRYSVRVYLVAVGKAAGNVVGLVVPIHSHGTSLLSPVEAPVVRERREVMS